MKPTALLLLAIPVVGLGLFFASRPAAAKNAAKDAFVVSPGCETIKVVDETQAKASAIAAALSVGLNPSANAIATLREIAKVILPTCPWGSAKENDIVFQVPGRGSYTWVQIQDFVGTETTVADFRKYIGEAFAEPTAAEFLLQALGAG